MKADKVVDGWWLARGGRNVTPHIVQLRVGDEIDLDSRGPFKTREKAEAACYRDTLESYWENNFSVWANHCLGCGRWAKVLAFDDAYSWDWRVTECKRCGILDSRVVTS